MCKRIFAIKILYCSFFLFEFEMSVDMKKSAYISIVDCIY